MFVSLFLLYKQAFSWKYVHKRKTSSKTNEIGFISTVCLFVSSSFFFQDKEIKKFCYLLLFRMISFSFHFISRFYLIVCVHQYILIRFKNMTWERDRESSLFDSYNWEFIFNDLIIRPFETIGPIAIGRIEKLTFSFEIIWPRITISWVIETATTEHLFECMKTISFQNMFISMTFFMLFAFNSILKRFKLKLWLSCSFKISSLQLVNSEECRWKLIEWKYVLVTFHLRSAYC